MKTRTVLVLSILVGVALGYALAYGRLWRRTMVTVGDREIWAEEEIPEGEGTPRVAVDEEEHDFGALDINDQGRHDFILSNVGDAPLKLTKGTTSCTCTSSLFEGSVLQPGESAPVRIEWKAKDFAGPFEQRATVLTNDPDREAVELVVRGRFTSPVDWKPHILVMHVSPHSSKNQGEVQVLGFAKPPLELREGSVTDPEHIRFEVEPLPESNWESGATSGHLVRVTVSPDLPAGHFGDTLTFETNCPKVPKVRIPLEGTVGSDFLIFGPDWRRDEGALVLDTVSRGQGARRTLKIQPPVGTTLEIDRVEPAWLNANLSPKLNDDGQPTGLVDLDVEVPPSAPVGSYMNEPHEARPCSILLKTSSSTTPTLKILVKVNVTQ